jgi:hypothetical protein
MDTFCPPAVTTPCLTDTCDASTLTCL